MMADLIPKTALQAVIDDLSERYETAHITATVSRNDVQNAEGRGKSHAYEYALKLLKELVETQ